MKNKVVENYLNNFSLINTQGMGSIRPGTVEATLAQSHRYL